MDSKDKTDIIIALRETASGIERGGVDVFALMQALGTELLTLALKNGPALQALDEMVPARLEMLIRREIASIADNVAGFHEGHLDERAILEERLFRRFDPALAWNEAINRAIERKKAAREPIDPQLLHMSPQQQFMFGRQKKRTYDALKNA